MHLKWGRLVSGVIVAELVPILLLVALVALFGPSEQSQAEVFAARLGRWVGPIGGITMTFLAALWVARPMRGFGLQHGVVLGCLVAVLDISLLFAAATAFEWIFAVSNVGRILAGTAGGALADRSPR